MRGCLTLVSFCLLTVTAAAGADSARMGQITGRVIYRGTVPRSTVGDDMGRFRELLRVEPRTGGLAEVMIYLSGELPAERDGDAMQQSSQSAAEAGDGAPLVIDQQNFTFVPRVVGVRRLAPVRFTNSDTANHNVRSAALEPENQFNVFTSSNADYVHRFVPNRVQRPVRLGCDIHGWMQAWIYVFDHRWYDVTDQFGKFALPALPAGTYQLEVRQPDVGLRATKKVVVKAGEADNVVIEFTEQDLPGERR